MVVRTPTGTVQPLIHSRPRTGLEAKFSLEYSLAAALLDKHLGFATFTDKPVTRPEAPRLVELVEVELTDGGDGLLAGEVEVEVHLRGYGDHPPRSTHPVTPERRPRPRSCD